MKSGKPDAKVIFGEALRLSVPAERQAYLDQACAGNPGLRQEVESLLSAHSQAGDFLGQTHHLPAPDFLIERAGTMIGRYKLLEKIGEGGFGVVYMAEQVAPVQRKVALKVIKLGMDTKEVIGRFEAERQALALMDHPNICKVLDGGATESGRPYFVMELVRGIPITDYCDQKALSTAERLRLFIRVCHAVQHAHQKGIIHRDLKPGNVLVTLHDGEPVPKVIDFGVAKALGQKLTAKTLFTGFAQMLGTPAYMSPEQAELSGVDIDTRGDIYSLGVLLYELLTGVTPFDKETLAKAALDEIRRMIREIEPSKPSTRLQTLGGRLTEVAKCRQTEPATLGRLVRGDLDWIVMKALEKDRTRRYETADGLARDLERHLSCQPVLASPPSAAYLLGKFIRRNRVAVSFVSLLVLALVVGLWSTLTALKRARQEQARAEAAATIATTVNDFVQFAMVDSLGEPAGTNAPLASRGMLDQLAGNIQRQFADRPLVEAGVRLGLGRTYLSLGDYSAAEQQVQRAAEIRQKELGPKHPATLEALASLGFLRFKQGDPAQAETLLRAVLEDQRHVLGEGDPAAIQTLVMLAAVQPPSGGASLTPDLLKAIKSLRNDDPRTLRALHSVVDSLRSEKRLLDAQTLGRELLNRREKVFGSNHTETVQALLCLSDTAEALERSAECEQLRREALRRGREVRPAGVDTLTAFKGLLDLVTEHGDYDEAQRLLEEELGIEKRVLGAEHETTRATQQFLSQIIQQKASAEVIDKKRRRQLALAEEAIRLDEANGGAWLQRALARAELGQWDLATDDFAQAMARTNTVRAAKTAEFALACLKLARLALPAGLPRTAERASREALRLFRQLEQTAPNEPEHALGAGKSLWQLGDVLLATQRKEEGKRVLDEALRLFEQGAGRWPEKPVLRQEQAFSHRMLAGFYESAGNSEDAEAHFRIAIGVYAALKKEFPTNTWYAQEEAYTTWSVAGCLDRARKWEAAEAAYAQAVSLQEKLVADLPGEPELKVRLQAIRLGLATLLEVQGNTVRADDLRQRALQEGPSGPSPAEGPPPAGTALLGRPVPGTFKLPLLNGGEIDLPSQGTNVLLLDFWATWCGPCRQVMPILADLAREYSARGVCYVAVNLREEPEGVRRYIANAKLDIAVALDKDGRVADAFRVRGIPTMVLLDRAGIIQKVQVGASPGVKADLTVALEDLLAGRKPTGHAATPPRPSQPVPPRAREATPEMVDLTGHFHAALTETWHPGNEANDLAHLPTGLQTFRGVPFDVRGIVQLSSAAMINVGGRPYPRRVQGIQIGRKCARFHFLHSTGWAVKDGTVVGSYVLRYADGSSRVLPIVYGEDVRDWWAGTDQALDMKNGQVAWQGRTSSGGSVRLYRRTWENPSPEREVASIDFISAMTDCAPFLLAITTEP